MFADSRLPVAVIFVLQTIILLQLSIYTYRFFHRWRRQPEPLIEAFLVLAIGFALGRAWSVGLSVIAYFGVPVLIWYLWLRVATLAIILVALWYLNFAIRRIREIDDENE